MSDRPDANVRRRRHATRRQLQYIGLSAMALASILLVLGLSW